MTADFPRCATCTWFHGNDELNVWECERIRLIGHDDPPPKARMFPDDYCTGDLHLEVSPDFGCILHEPKETDVLKTPEEWLQEDEFSGIRILDPDGWRGRGAPAWEEPITRGEFQQLLVRCTVDMSKSLRGD